MSGQEIGTVVGGIIGAYFGNVQLGMAIGGLVGGYVDPTKIKGPHIGQGQTQTATTGVPIAWVQGTAKVAGTIIAIGPRREVKVEDNGKGSSTVNITYEARQDFAILICESSDLRDSTIDAIVMVEQDGKIVYDMRPDSKYQAASLKWAGDIVDFYFGAEDQLPPATLEALFGVGSTPGYRGRCLAVFKDFNVTAAGDRIPQFVFTVASAATLTPVDNVLEDYSVTLDNGMRHSVSTTELFSYVLDYSVLEARGQPAIGDYVITDSTAEPEYWAFGLLGFLALVGCEHTILSAEKQGVATATIIDTMVTVTTYFDFETGWRYGAWPVVPANALAWFDRYGLTEPPVLGNGIPAGTDPLLITTIDNTIEGLRYVEFQHSNNVYDVVGHEPTIKFALTDNRPLVRLGGGYWKDTSDGSLWRPSWVSSADLNTVAPQQLALSTVVSRICKRCGLEDADFDVTALAGTVVDGYPIATQCAGDEALLPLLQAYFAYGTDCDGKIVFKFYGEDAIVTVARDDLVLNDASEGAISLTRRNQATEFPQKLTVQYIDPAQNYNTNTQSAERLASTVIAIGETTLQIPVAMTAVAAAQAADKALKIAYATLEGTQDYSVPFATPNADYLTLCAGEPLFMDGKRWVCDEIDISNMSMKFSTRYDRQSAYGSNVQAIIANTPPPPLAMYSGPTLLLPMNLPSLRPQDTYGIYLVARGVDETTWRGCTVQVSFDGKASWQNALVITAASIMGTLTADEIETGSFAGDTIVDIGDIDTLYSVTDAQLAARMNAYALVDATGATEIRQFKTAALQDATSSEPDVTWLLSDQSTGLLGTTHKDYLTGDRFAMLSAAYFLPIDITFKGATLYLRGVGFGELAEDTAIVAIVYNPDTTVIHDGGVVTP